MIVKTFEHYRAQIEHESSYNYLLSDKKDGSKRIK